MSPTPTRSRTRILLQVALAALVVVGGVAVATHLVRTKPEAKRRPVARLARLVEVVETGQRTEQVVVEASGTVMPAREIDIFARVTGEVVEISPVLQPGGLLAANEVLVRVDDADYLLAERQARSNLARAQAEQRLEQGNQRIAKAERALLGGELAGDEGLMLRRPQLAVSLAVVDAARATLDRAHLDRERTVLKAPFNAVVRSRTVDLGSRISPTTPLARLAGTDTWWIEVLVPVDQLRWIQVPRTPTEEGSAVKIFHEAAWGPGITRTGHVVRLAAELEEKGRMAKLLVAVADPLARLPENAQLPALHLGAWVRTEIEGESLANVVPLDRKLLRDGDRAWIMNQENRLEIRDLNIAWRARDHVLVRAGLAVGERVVSTDLSTPVAGMQLQLLGARDSERHPSVGGAP